MVNILSPADIQARIAQALREARLAANLTQQGLASRAGVSLGSLKRFEREGEVSLKNLTKLAFALRLEGELSELFRSRMDGSLDELIERTKTNQRQRGRKS